MRTRTILVTLALALLVPAGTTRVRAACGTPGSTFTSDYFTAPVGQSVLAAQGIFWGIGQYLPASPGGTDNGLWPATEWLRYTDGAGFYLAGDWATLPLIDGCIHDPPNPQPASMAAVWSTSDGTDSYFVALCAGEDAIGTFGRLTEIPGAAMTRVPKPVVRFTSRAGNTTNITLQLEPFVGGVYTPDGCALAVTGYKVYTRQTPRGTAGPVGRLPSQGWTLAAGVLPIGQDAVVQHVCSVDSNAYFMATLVLDGNVEIPQGSRNSLRIECGPNLATPDDEPPVIRRPKTTKGR